MHGVSFKTGLFGFVRHFGGRYYEGIIGFANKVRIAVMVAVAVADKNILAFNIFRFGFFPSIAVEERIKYDRYFAVG